EGSLTNPNSRSCYSSATCPGKISTNSWRNIAALNNVLPVVFYAIGASHIFGSKDIKAIFGARHKVDPRFMGLVLLKLTHPTERHPTAYFDGMLLQYLILEIPNCGVTTQYRHIKDLAKLVLDREESIDRSSLMDRATSLVAGPGFSSSITQICSGVLLIAQLIMPSRTDDIWPLFTIPLKSPSFGPSMTPASRSLQTTMDDRRVDLKPWPPIISDPAEELRLGFWRQNGINVASDLPCQFDSLVRKPDLGDRLGISPVVFSLVKLVIIGGLPAFALNCRNELELLLYPVKAPNSSCPEFGLWENEDTPWQRNTKLDTHQGLGISEGHNDEEGPICSSLHGLVWACR
ncbi:unnamed protein product, partial [Clonostachys byssicola]